jgi:hypothetical protein
MEWRESFALSSSLQPSQPIKTMPTGISQPTPKIKALMQKYNVLFDDYLKRLPVLRVTEKASLNKRMQDIDTQINYQVFLQGNPLFKQK